jgi:hypothetical protein
MSYADDDCPISSCYCSTSYFLMPEATPRHRVLWIEEDLKAYLQIMTSIERNKRRLGPWRLLRSEGELAAATPNRGWNGFVANVAKQESRIYGDDPQKLTMFIFVFIPAYALRKDSSSSSVSPHQYSFFSNAMQIYAVTIFVDWQAQTQSHLHLYTNKTK